MSRPKKKEVATCTIRCKDCAYSYWTGFRSPTEVGVGCDYLLVTGKIRPCPAGDDCTEFEQKGQKRKRRRFN